MGFFILSLFDLSGCAFSHGFLSDSCIIWVTQESGRVAEVVLDHGDFLEEEDLGSDVEDDYTDEDASSEGMVLLACSIFCCVSCSFFGFVSFLCVCACVRVFLLCFVCVFVFLRACVRVFVLSSPFFLLCVCVCA